MSDDICGVTCDTTDEPCQHPAGENGFCHIPAHNPDDGGSNAGGRPTKLNVERQEGIASMVEEGRSLRSSARVHNVSPQSVMNWLDRGQAEYEKGNDNIYAEFFERIEQARGYGEEWYYSMIVEIAKEEGDHRFLASLMKQRYPDSWAESDDAPGVNDDAGTVINIPDTVVEQWQRSK